MLNPPPQKKPMKCLVRLTALIGTAAAERTKTKYSTLLEWVADNREYMILLLMMEFVLKMHAIFTQFSCCEATG